MEHCLLNCNSFKEHIRDPLDSVEAVLKANNSSSIPSYEILDLLLYGHESQSLQVNMSISEMTIEFI